MKTRQRRLSALALAPLIAALTACGGGGGDSGDSGMPANANGSSAATVQGIYQGSMTGSANNVFQMLVLEDGTYWALYGTSSGEGFAVNGFLQGSGASGTGTFTSSNVRDFGFSPSVQANVRASFSSSVVSGTLTEPNVSSNFSGNLASDETYQYDTPASRSAVTGDWTLNLLDGTTASASVASTGAFTATNEGCTLTGTLSPRASGKNVFDVAITFGPAPCELPGGTASGIAWVATQGRNAELTLLAVDSTRTYGLAADGTR